jgi:hypothetical protein
MHALSVAEKPKEILPTKMSPKPCLQIIDIEEILW